MVPTRHVVSGWVVGGHHERVREAVIKYPHSSRNLKDTGTLYVEGNFSQWVSSPASRAIVLRDPLKPTGREPGRWHSTFGCVGKGEMGTGENSRHLPNNHMPF